MAHIATIGCDKNMVVCHSCGRSDFEDYKALAIHISSEKKGHKKGKRWAAKFILMNGLSSKNKFEHKERVPLSEQDKDNKEDSHRELSGNMEYVNTKCPKCRRFTPRTLEVEYVESITALRGDNGVLMMYCSNCGGRI
jgi:hypothetical protein